MIAFAMTFFSVFDARIRVQVESKLVSITLASPFFELRCDPSSRQMSHCLAGTCLLAHPPNLLLCTLLSHHEAPDKTHDQIQVRAMVLGQKILRQRAVTKG